MTDNINFDNSIKYDNEYSNEYCNEYGIDFICDLLAVYQNSNRQLKIIEVLH